MLQPNPLVAQLAMRDSINISAIATGLKTLEQNNLLEIIGYRYFQVAPFRQTHTVEIAAGVSVCSDPVVYLSLGHPAPLTLAFQIVFRRRL
jgi:hypothetical protein